MKPKFGYIYKLTFASGLSYIGQTTTTIKTRLGGHRHAAENGAKFVVYNAWRKYGEPKVQQLGKFLVEDLGKMEAKFIKDHGTFSKGYNMTPGGEQSPFCVPEIRKKAAAKMRITMRTPEVRKKISITRKGIAHTQERKDAISRIKQGHVNTAEHNKAISEGLKGKPKSEAHRAIIKQLGKDPIVNAKRSASIKATFAKSDVKARRSEAIMLSWIVRKLNQMNF
jgi:hypothetical protein